MKYNVICQVVYVAMQTVQVGGSDPSDESFSKPKKRKTERWLNNLLNRIRSQTQTLYLKQEIKHIM